MTTDAGAPLTCTGIAMIICSTHGSSLRPKAECTLPGEQNGVYDRLCYLPAQTFASDVVGPEVLAGVDSAQSRLLAPPPRSW